MLMSHLPLKVESQTGGLIPAQMSLYMPDIWAPYFHNMTIIDDGDAIKSHGHQAVSEAQSSSFSCPVSSQEVKGLLECLRESPLIRV